MLAGPFLHGRIEIELVIWAFDDLPGVGVAGLGPREDCLWTQDSGIVLPDVRCDVLRGEDLPLIHDEVVAIGRSFIAAGEDVERVADDDRCGVGGVVGAVGEDWVAAAVDCLWRWYGGGLRIASRDSE